MRELLYLLAAIGVHGGGHLIASLACGMRPCGIDATATGLRLRLRGDFCSYGCELAVALGGPLGNLCGGGLLWLITLCAKSTACYAPLRAVCREMLPLSLFLALWNLLPIRGFDGGRMLRCLLLAPPRRALTPDTADRILSLTSAACALLLWLLSVCIVLRTARALSLLLFCIQLLFGLWGEGDTANDAYQKNTCATPHGEQRRHSRAGSTPAEGQLSRSKRK